MKGPEHPVGFIHERDPARCEVEKAVLDRAGAQRQARIDGLQADGIPGLAHFGGQEVLLDTDELPGFVFRWERCFAVIGAAQAHHGTVRPSRSRYCRPGLPHCARRVFTICGMASSMPKGASGPPNSVRIQPGAIKTRVRTSLAWRAA